MARGPFWWVARVGGVRAAGESNIRSDGSAGSDFLPWIQAVMEREIRPMGGVARYSAWFTSITWPLGSST